MDDDYIQVDIDAAETKVMLTLHEYAEQCGMTVIDCPECGNSNRTARRGCSFCNRTGKYLKHF